MIKIIIKDILGIDYNENLVVSKQHNYIDLERRIVRKGAQSSNLGETIIIPLNMRDGTIIAKGVGNESWNSSAPHGAGRKLSRKKAFESITLNEFKYTMKAINTFSVTSSTIDESPMAYKDKHELIKDSFPTIQYFEVLECVYNFKDKGESNNTQ